MEEIDIKDRINIWLGYSSLNVKELSEKSGLNYHSLQSIRRGAVKSPSRETIDKICSGFGITYEQFMAGPEALQARPVYRKTDDLNSLLTAIVNEEVESVYGSLDIAERFMALERTVKAHEQRIAALEDRLANKENTHP